jgi:plasmid segregation protein ParM
MTEILALDIGYGYTKALTPRGHPVVIPSLVGPAELIRYESDIITENGHGIALEVDGRSLFVGDYAELQSASVAQTLDVTRTGSLEQKALFYAVASALIPTNAQEVAVVTGLPVGDYDDRNKETLRRMLTGRHEVRRQGKRPRTFTVTGTYIIPQAMGSLFALILDRRGKLVDSDLAAGRVGIVDIGTLTTNYVLVDRLRYVEVGSDSITSGMGELLQKVAKDLKREYGLDWAMQLRKVDLAVQRREVEVYGDRINISGLVAPHLEALADTLLSKARTLWGSGVELKAIVLTGGGSLEMAPFFRRVFPHVRTVPGDPQMANVVGYLRAGLRRFGGTE